MIEWTERAPGLAGIAYEPPTGIARPPAPPRAAFDATGLDGARLEAYRWGSAIGGIPFLLELRRWGVRIPATRERPFPVADPQLPTLDELQAALDQLIPPGTPMMLIMSSNGPDTTYSYSPYACVRVGQPATFAAPGGIDERRVLQ